MIAEYQAHNRFLMEQVKEKNVKLSNLRKENENYKEALEYISELKQPDGGYVSRLDAAITKAKDTLKGETE